MHSSGTRGFIQPRFCLFLDQNREPLRRSWPRGRSRRSGYVGPVYTASSSWSNATVTLVTGSGPSSRQVTSTQDPGDFVLLI